jgi:transposase
MILEGIMARAKNGKAISETRKTRAERRRLKRLLSEAERKGDLATWKRAKAISGYIRGMTVIVLAEQLGVARATINRWMRWFEAEGTDGLRTKIQPGGMSRLTSEQSEELVKTIEEGPEAAGFTSGVWTGPMIGEWIRRQFGVTYHSQHIPRLLHKLGFSVQRPRRRLARADVERQEIWLKQTFPKIKKKPGKSGALYSSRTRRVSGSTVRSTERGQELGISHGLIPTANDRQPTSTAL